MRFPPLLPGIRRKHERIVCPHRAQPDNISLGHCAEELSEHATNLELVGIGTIDVPTEASAPNHPRRVYSTGATCLPRRYDPYPRRNLPASPRVRRGLVALSR